MVYESRACRKSGAEIVSSSAISYLGIAPKPPKLLATPLPVANCCGKRKKNNQWRPFFMTYHMYIGTKDVAYSNSNLQFYASLISRNILEKISREIAKLLKFID